MWSMIATWPFSLQCVEKGEEILKGGGRALDAAERGIHLVETDPTVDCVGRGGYLNADGELALDAAMMDGDTLKMGVVACVRGFEHPVSIARAVMEKTKHSILVGQYAEAFARRVGFQEAPPEYMITDHARRKYEEETGKASKPSGHDTIGCVALDQAGSLCVAASTSGANLRLPGRVGDTPIIGSGFYVQSGVGGAAATGLGEDIMRTCCSFRVVDLMRRGLSAQDAVNEVVLTAHNTLKQCGLKPDCIALVCMDARGNTAGACNHKGFVYACAREGEAPHLVEVEPIIDKDEEQEG